jgi:hypothetical protein
MSVPHNDDSAADAEAAKAIRRVRRLMVISLAMTIVAVAVVIGIIGYRVFSGDESVPFREVTASLPKNARIIAASVSGDRILVTVDVNGAIEVHSFNARSFKPAGRLRFATEP